MTEAAARAWIDAHVERIAPLHTAANRASWQAATTGAEEALDRSTAARIDLRLVYSDAGDAARVREMLASPELEDPLLRRELVLLDLVYTENQLPRETIDDLAKREAELERIFYTFRPPFEGAEASNNQLLEVLREEPQSGRRRAAWEASKRVAGEVAEPLRELVRRRNAAARHLGFRDFYSMRLQLQEIEEGALFEVLGGFRDASDAAFEALREEMDGTLARRFDVAPEELRPWHWEDFFCQEAPRLDTVDLDPLFRDRDLETLARDYFDELGLPLHEVLARSDLYERPGKDQHAFCTDIDRAGDVRILCNLRPTENWMGTLLHELGHAAYDRYLPSSLPYLLRTPAHTMVTEAIAMLMGRRTRDPRWLESAAGATLEYEEAAAVRSQLRAGMLVSARWMLVMVHFERELYRDPERPDLNSLWWEMVERLQRVRRPEGRDEPDWAAKIHLSLAPVYYHNYLLGEMTASQLGAAAARHPRVGDFLRGEVFARGATLPWNDLLVEVKGEPLSSRAFLEEFVESPPQR